MNDLSSKLLEVLCYCDKDGEAAARAIGERISDFSQLAQLDQGVLEPICGEKNAVFIRLLAALSGRRITDKFKFGKVYTEKEVFDFLRGYYLDIVNETVLILPIDERGRVVCAEIVIEGTVNFSGILTRKLLEIMIKHNSKKAILAHNHPGGKATPSVEDVETTRIVEDLMLTSNMELVAHYVVAGGDVQKVDTVG